MLFEGNLPLEENAFMFNGWFAPVQVDSTDRGPLLE